MKILNKSENNNKVVYMREQAIIKLSYYDCLLGNMIANYDIGHGLYIFNLNIWTYLEKDSSQEKRIGQY